MKRTLTRQELQSILETNELKAPVTYSAREVKDVDNAIVYFRTRPAGRIEKSDGRVHIPKFTVKITHFHKHVLDSIEDLMLSEFGIQPTMYDVAQPDTEFYATYYEFELFGGGKW